MNDSSNQYITAELNEKEIVTVQFKVIDVIYKAIDASLLETIFSYLIQNETPTKLSASQFQTTNSYRTGTLQVFLNGIKINSNEITEDAINKFTFANYATDNEDLIEVSYIKN